MWRTKKKEQVNIVGPHATPQLKKKKKKEDISVIPNGTSFTPKSFTFIDVYEHWMFLDEARFRAFTHSSSFVGNVKYDQDEQSMEIILSGKTYNFCNVSERLFDAFEGSNSKGEFFNREIKTLHDC